MRLNALSKWLEGRRARAVRKPRRAVLGVTVFEDRRVPASLSGGVFQDLNNNGVRDGSEAGIAGVKVHLVGRTDGRNPDSLVSRRRLRRGRWIAVRA